MFVIGVDLHKGSHTAAALDGDERVHGELRVRADRYQRRRLLAWAEAFSPRTWAVEGATGTGFLFGQQLVAASETVLDIPPPPSARARLLDSGSTDKTDPHDARSAAIVALRHTRLRLVTGEDHVAILRLLARRHHDLTAQRTQAVCRLHTVLCLLTAGGAPQRRAGGAGAAAHRADGRDRRGTQAPGCRLLADVRRADCDLAELRARIVAAVEASKTASR
jgi:transposase